MGLLDAVILGYFISHIPITMLFDAQSILPPSVYPEALRGTLSWYCQQYADPLMCTQPAWFRAIAWIELVVQTPFFFVAVYGWLRRAEWLRIPLVAYGAHVATTLIPIYGALWDAYQAGTLAQHQFTFLASVYAPYLIIPLFLMLYAGSRKQLFDVPSGAGKGAATGKKRQ